METKTKLKTLCACILYILTNLLKKNASDFVYLFVQTCKELFVYMDQEEQIVFHKFNQTSKKTENDKKDKKIKRIKIEEDSSYQINNLNTHSLEKPKENTSSKHKTYLKVSYDISRPWTQNYYVILRSYLIIKRNRN